MQSLHSTLSKSLLLRLLTNSSRLILMWQLTLLAFYVNDGLMGRKLRSWLGSLARLTDSYGISLLSSFLDRAGSSLIRMIFAALGMAMSIDVENMAR